MSTADREAERRQTAAQGDLFGDDATVGRGRAGRAERRVTGAINAAKTANHLSDIDDGMAVLAIECARAIDVAARRSDPYAIAAAGRELRETLTRLKLDPTARGGGVDASIEELLAKLGTPEMGDTANT